MDISNKKTVQLVGLGPSAVECLTELNGVERWGIQYCWQHYKLTRAFVMDDEEWILAKNHSYENPLDIESDMKRAGIPIYVSKKWKNVENTVEYPIEEIKAKFPHYFMNSFAYMMALAIHEGFERIELFGWDFRYFNEFGKLIFRPCPEMKWEDFMKGAPSWSYEEFMNKRHNWLDETHCGNFWVGLAIGRGIEVILTKRSSLMKPLVSGDTGLYGYETSPSIQTIRNEVLAKRKKLGEPQKVTIFRRPLGMSTEEFKKQIQVGAIKPHGYSTAKMVEEVAK